MENEILVKVCSKCGIFNSERAEKCESCGTKLDEAIGKKEAEELSEEIEKRNKKVSAEIAAAKGAGVEPEIDLPVSPFRKVLGIVMIVVTALLIITTIVMMFCPNPYEGKDITALVAGALLWSLIMAYLIALCLYPGKVWSAQLAFSRHRYDQVPIPSEYALNLQCVAFIMFILLTLGGIGLEIWTIYEGFMRL